MRKDGVPEFLRGLDPREILDGATGSGVDIAILDTGLDLDHPMMDGVQRRLKKTVSFATGEPVVDAPLSDLASHGTPVSWIVNRIAPEADLTFIQVVNASGSCRPENFYAALDYAVRQNYKVINLSLGVDEEITDFWKARFLDLVDQAYFRDLNLVAAGSNRFDWIVPGSFSSLVSVNSEDFPDPLQFRIRAAAKLLHGPRPQIWLDALGCMVKAPFAGSRAQFHYIGTSFAAPHITGIVARLLSRYPELRVFEVKTLLYRMAQVYEGMREGAAAEAGE